MAVPYYGPDKDSMFNNNSIRCRSMQALISIKFIGMIELFKATCEILGPQKTIIHLYLVATTEYLALHVLLVKYFTRSTLVYCSLYGTMYIL